MTPPFLKMCSHYWNQLMDGCSVADGPARQMALAQIVTCYGEPHRFYHTLGHIIYMLDGLSEMSLLASILPREERNNVRLATWYHDIVYDTHRCDNEDRSAEMVRNALSELGFQEYSLTRICDLISMTKNHYAPAADLAACWFLDADLSILSGDPEDYQQYVDGVRKEYAWVPDSEFYRKRRAILQGFLERPKIFLTAEWQDFEAIARKNLAGEIAQIDEILRTWPS